MAERSDTFHRQLPSAGGGESGTQAALNSDQIGQFKTQGYLVVENALPGAILDAVRDEYAALLETLYAGWQAEGRVGAPVVDDFWGKLLSAYRAGCDWFQPMDISLPGDTIHADTPFHFGQAVFDLLTAPAVLDIVESLLGGEITSNPIQHVRIKPPARDLYADEARAHITATAWHQDRGVTHAEADATDMITVWIAMTDATPDNGCLMVEPRARAMLPHCPQSQTSIPASHLSDAPRALPVPAGSVILLHPLTPHASLPNRTDGFRWSFDLRYHVTGQPSGRDWFPEFVARSRTAPDTELHDWQRWRALWEDARSRLAAQPHIPIHRWTSDSPYCA